MIHHICTPKPFPYCTSNTPTRTGDTGHYTSQKHNNKETTVADLGRLDRAKEEQRPGAHGHPTPPLLHVQSPKPGPQQPATRDDSQGRQKISTPSSCACSMQIQIHDLSKEHLCT